MKLVSFGAPAPFGEVRRLGALDGDLVIDLKIAYQASLEATGADPTEAHRLTATSLPSTMEKLVAVGPPALMASKKALEFVRLAGSETQPKGLPTSHHIGDVRLLPPLMPNSLKDFLAFEDHAMAGAKRRGEALSNAWKERPVYYKGNHRAILGPGEDLERPAFTKELDLELEVGCILGRKGRDLDATSADAFIFGFTILNDFSARDVQRAEMSARLGPAKSKDFATAMGPCIVTADELSSNPPFQMTARLNGDVLIEANLSEAKWSFSEMIAYVSQGEEVWPGDVYGSGTPFGGCLLDHNGPYLEPGDLVELEVSGIGLLANRVVGQN